MRSSCSIHQVLFGHPYLCAMDDFPGIRWSYYRGTCIVPTLDAIVGLLLLRSSGCDQVMDVVSLWMTTMDEYS